MTRDLLPPERYARLLDELTAALAAHNEDPDAFYVNGPYLQVCAVVPT